jgi:hypothetical protein
MVLFDPFQVFSFGEEGKFMVLITTVAVLSGDITSVVGYGATLKTDDASLAFFGGDSIGKHRANLPTPYLFSILPRLRQSKGFAAGANILSEYLVID